MRLVNLAPPLLEIVQHLFLLESHGTFLGFSLRLVKFLGCACLNDGATDLDVILWRYEISELRQRRHLLKRILVADALMLALSTHETVTWSERFNRIPPLESIDGRSFRRVHFCWNLEVRWEFRYQGGAYPFSIDAL